jgi:hypothetical protein
VQQLNEYIADVLSRFVKTIVVHEREVEVEEFLKTIHNSTMGHSDASRLLKRLECLYIAWSGMLRDIEDYIQRYEPCKKFEAYSDLVLHVEDHTLPGSKPMELVSVDAI